VSPFHHLDDLVPQQIWTGVVGRSVHGAEATLAAIELDPGAEVPEHAHANEQTGVLVRGSLTFRIGTETRELRPGSMWVIPANVPHGVTVGPDGASLYELFSPPRTDWASLEQLEPSPAPGF
jgi:quercetin dioxygenase-like cupin family protein